MVAARRGSMGFRSRCVAASIIVGVVAVVVQAEEARAPKLPPGVSPTLYALSVPPGKEPSPEKVALGDKLFNDKRLSADNTVSCATCHDPARGFVDHKALSEGIKKQHTARNSPTVLNALFNGKARCGDCHAVNAVNPLFSDQKFHNIGIAAHKQDFAELAKQALAVLRTGDEKQIDELAIGSDKFTELGRFLVTKNQNDIGAFKTPTLRNVAITGPYMHDGSMETLWDVIDHYNKGGVPNPFLDGGMQRLGVSESESQHLVAFL